MITDDPSLAALPDSGSSDFSMGEYQEGATGVSMQQSITYNTINNETAAPYALLQTLQAQHNNTTAEFHLHRKAFDLLEQKLSSKIDSNHMSLSQLEATCAGKF